MMKLQNSWKIIVVLSLVFMILYGNAHAQSGPAVVTVDQQINPCRVVGGWVGEIWCHFVYIVAVETFGTNNPPTTPTPTPTPAPTPVPVEVEYLQSQGVETVEPWKPWQTVEECKFTLVWRHCQIQVRFEITQAQCVEPIEISLRYTDDTYKNARVDIVKYWPDDQGRLWLQFYRLAYDYASGFEAWRYTATVTCAK